MVTLLLNGQPFPSSLLGNLNYVPVAVVDGAETPAEHWILSTDSGVLIDTNDTRISFAPVSAEPHHLHVFALNHAGFREETLVTFNVVLQGSGVTEAGVTWNQPSYQVGNRLEGTVYVADPEGFPPLDISWVLYRNGVPALTGTGPKLAYVAAIDGVYTVKILAHDVRNNIIQGESTVVVTNNYELQATPPPPPMTGSTVYLGALYSDEMNGPAGICTYLPYPVVSFTQEFYLLPGTTHVAFEIEGAMDDEVVVRTKIGNFAINSFPTGLYNQALAYDYLPTSLLPAPADLKTRLTFDGYNAHGSTYGAFRFRIKIKCYALTDKIYQYERCPYSFFPGGQGLRQRRLAFIFTGIETVVDSDTTADRYLTRGATVDYTTDEVTSLPRTWLLSDGTPYPVNASTNFFFTEANRYAIYESEDAEELDAKAVCAVENVRPFYFSLQMPGHPPVVQTIKRLKGKMVLYLADGGLSAGSVVNARINTGLGDVLYSFPIAQDVYVNTTTDFIRVMSVDVDVSDFQFGINGVVVRCDIDETGVSYSGTTPDVLPVWSEGSIFTKTLAPAVDYDGACFTNPTLVTMLDEDAGVVVGTLAGCYDSLCGPQGVYCYSAVCEPFSATVKVVQPLYHPAPFVALTSDPSFCYGSPLFVAAGSQYVVSGGTIDAISGELVYSTGSVCGKPALYNPCNGGAEIAVIYPCTATPHDFVKWVNSCYFLSGTVAQSGTMVPSLNFSAFANWMVEGGTVDLIGQSRAYTLYDLVPGNGMYVDMIGSPSPPVLGQFGTLVSKQAWELSAGVYRLSIDFAGNQRTAGTPTPFSMGVSIGNSGTAWFEDNQTQPFQRYRFTYTATGSEYVTIRVFQNTASPWGTLYNAGNLLNYVHFYRVGPPQVDLLYDYFDDAPTVPLPDTVISVNDVSVVADCQDYVCTGSNPNGDAYTYLLTDSGSQVRVAFEGLDMGVPQFAVSPTTTSVGTGRLESGSISFLVAKKRTRLIARVPDSGTLAFKIIPAGVDKSIIRVRGGVETAYFLPAGRDSTAVDVAANDTIWLEFPRVSVRILNKPCTVKWTPRLVLLREYATAVVNNSGAVYALGFCGLTNRSDYVLYRTLPSDSQTDAVVNPDCIVTLSGTDGVEYAVIRNTALNEVRPPIPFPWYSGQSFNGSMTFHFYAGRHYLGAHGEMDVWTDVAGTFPNFFRISEYFGLYGSNAYRCDSQFGDISRNSVRVVPSMAGIGLPSQYYATDGELRTIHSQAFVLDADKHFTLAKEDPGISYNIQHLTVTQTFAGISDFHGGLGNITVKQQIQTMVAGWAPEYVVSGGDLVTTSPAGLTSAIIDNWVGQYWTINMPWRFYTTQGNHDWESVAGEAVFRTYFNVPTPPWYDRLEGDVHWFFIDGGYDNTQVNRWTGLAQGMELSGAMGATAQGLWLMNALAQSTARWKIVVCHYPAYSSCVGSIGIWPDGYLQYRGLRMPLKAWGADLYLFGHCHMYERLLAPDGLTHVNFATAGYLAPANFRPVPTPDATSLVRYNGNLGALRGRVTDAGLVIEWWSVSSSDGMIDTFTLPVPYWLDDDNNPYLDTDGAAIEVRL